MWNHLSLIFWNKIDKKTNVGGVNNIAISTDHSVNERTKCAISKEFRTTLWAEFPFSFTILLKNDHTPFKQSQKRPHIPFFIRIQFLGKSKFLKRYGFIWKNKHRAACHGTFPIFRCFGIVYYIQHIYAHFDYNYNGSRVLCVYIETME